MIRFPRTWIVKEPQREGGPVVQAKFDDDTQGDVIRTLAADVRYQLLSVLLGGLFFLVSSCNLGPIAGDHISAARSVMGCQRVQRDCSHATGRPCWRRGEYSAQGYEDGRPRGHTSSLHFDLCWHHQPPHLHRFRIDCLSFWQTYAHDELLSQHVLGEQSRMAKPTTLPFPPTCRSMILAHTPSSLGF